MSTRSRSPKETAQAVIGTARDEDITFIAASVAYYAFVSLLPALLLLIVLASTIGGEAFADRLITTTQGFLTPTGQETIQEALEGASGRGGATIIGVAGLVWSTLKVFRALDTVFTQVYGGDESPGFVDQLVDASLVAIGIGLGLTAMVVVGAVNAALPDLGPLDRVISLVFLPLLLFVVFLPMYRQFPNPPLSIREAIPGAVFTAVGWAVLQAGFQVYAAGAGQYQLYGVVGGILLLVTWLYLAAILVIFGAIINAILSGRRSTADSPTSDRQLQQDRVRESEYMAREGDEFSDADDARRRDVEPAGAPDIAELDERVAELRADLDTFESDIRERTVEKPDLEAELKRYVRSRMRRGHARGWGPYLVLLYGTVLTLGAFFTFESAGLAILAMLIIFLSTLGLYVIFITVGIGLNLIETPGKAIDYARDRRQ
ncbi:YhjD/YihY/BrkB family envelope integrity protein [Haloferacaceae archaeon DSL9]